LTANARFEGKVQGVVVQASTLYSRQSTGARDGFLFNLKLTVTALSARSLYELSSLVSKFDSGVSHAHEYGITRIDS
jgi:hypothetical protein